MATQSKQKEEELKMPDFEAIDAEIAAEEARLAAKRADAKAKKLEWSRKNAEGIKRKVQIQLEEMSQEVASLIADGFWNWRSGEFDQALDALELQPEASAPITITDEFKKAVLNALGTTELRIDALATKLDQKSGSIRARINAMVEQGLLSSTDDPSHSGKGRAPKLYKARNA